VRLVTEEYEQVAALKRVARHSPDAARVHGSALHRAAFKLAASAEHNVCGEERAGIVVVVADLTLGRSVFVILDAARAHWAVGLHLLV
jgi:hypothetical protein